MSNCPKGHFLCTNKKCVNGLAMCDGNDDCGDNSDETTGCTGKLFNLSFCIIHLYNTQTIIKTLPLIRLRYIMLLGNCPLHHFQCKNKRCVPHSKICNANNDCGDNSDEIDGCTGINYVHFKYHKNII